MGRGATEWRAGDRAEIRSVGRALDLLDMMQRKAPAGIRVRDAADQLGVDPATASRLLSTLIAHGYASRLPNRQYMLGTRSLRLATAWVDRLIEVAAAPMARIADSCSGTVYLLQLVGTEAVALARLTGDRRTMSYEIGPSYPLWASAAGRALLSSVPPVLRPALLPPEPFPAFTARTKTRWADISAALQSAQHEGVHAEEGEVDPQLSCYATPLPRGKRNENLAMAISFESGRLEGDRRLMRQALRHEWREIAKQI
ncbi:MAG TPA: IclR family transcriptional regulator C-terminal domain-containing protein [Alphaproteobacteria bacterium]|jgi:IclR family acetate operon transcriptional repressor